ncbi:hypothetical protein C8R44DRAFT_767033, partial [Mycena epipterygia]
MLWSHFFLLSLCLHSVFAKLVTTIIDDAFPGDTQSSISYTPPNVWVIGSATNNGRIKPDASQALDGTWHDATDDTTPDHDGTTPLFMGVNFQGTGIDVRCIIPNNLNDPSIPPFTGTKSNYSFFIDSVPQNRNFEHQAGTTGDAFNYNVSVFSTNTLSNGPHTLKLLLNGGPEVNGSVLLLFDYAIITSDDGTGDSGSSSTTTAGPTSTPAATPPTVTSTAGASVKSSTSSSSQSRTVGSSDPATSTSSVIQTQRPPTSGSATLTQPTLTPSPIQSSAAHKSHIGAIVGGVSGCILIILGLIILFFWLRRRRSHRSPDILPFTDANIPYSTPYSPLRHFTSRKTRDVDSISPSRPSPPRQQHNPNQPAQSTATPSAGSSTQSNLNSVMRDYMTLRAEVEQLRQEREMVGMQLLSPSHSDPPPR